MTPPESSPHQGNSGKNKPRWGCNFLGQKDTVIYDEEFWIGISIYLPTDFEEETSHSGNGTTLVLHDVTENGGPSGVGFMTLNILNPNGQGSAGNLPGDYNQWVIQVAHTDTKANNGDSDDQIWYSLGRASDDYGKWTNFVTRLRINPFGVGASTHTGATNPADEGIQGGQDLLFQPDRGILQIWKDDVLVHDQENEPVGGVPNDTFTPDVDIRAYRFGWHHNSATAVAGPIEIAYGAVRYGHTNIDGTGYADVHPLGTAQP